MSVIKAVIDIYPTQQATAFSVHELEWLAKKSYNIALRLRDSKETEHTLVLLDLSIKLTTLLPQQTHATNSSLNETYLLCEFFRTTKHISLARQTTDPPAKQAHYTAAHKSSSAFQSQITGFLQLCRNPEATYAKTTSSAPTNATIIVDTSANTNATPPPEEGDAPTLWLERYRIILAVDLEASIYLNTDDTWSHITSLIQTSAVLNSKLISVYLDTLLRAKGAPLTKVVQAIKLIIRTIHASPSPDINNLTTLHTDFPRYLHVLYQLALEAHEDRLAESVLDQVLVLVRDCKTEGFPPTEMQWMAAVAFNRAVDFYLAAKDVECRRWAEKAIALAEVGGVDGDGGALARLLRGRYGKLMLGEEGGGNSGSSS
ncbi:uncharacterized protein BP01DRAFT_85144 [Aspergillus saccharolyticus JOP 1030-1]|uniref:Uncharacterized protein n=1 Tax=Aspergillus saccharolyticus JOP 1030-1 TaxID=1450539 RepID=A0A318Z9X9_9EURO|nr:hypothetical protein BP01DRAFT_85144 [Aspergillus saccharolyticus JOP 1030-1]PYH44221.1 hypothetical protein BP01DRAFT_85144 [Aspergillus saccharolyticus JOP 1030-1]